MSVVDMHHAHNTHAVHTRHTQVDRHKYVKLAYHGARCLSSDERDLVYNCGSGEALPGG